MTEKERYETIGRVVSDHEAAKRHLTELRARGKVLDAFCRGVGLALADEGPWRLEGGALHVRAASGSGVPSITMDWPSFAEVTAHLQDLAATKTRVEQLEKQRRELGV